MRIGLMAPSTDSLEVNEAVVRGAEALEMDSVWVPDHLLGPFHPDLWRELPVAAMMPDSDAYLDPFCLLTVLGRDTDLDVGTCVTDGTRRRGADLARAAQTIHRAARGNFILGIGAGEAESLVPFGYPFDRPVGLLEETLRDIRSLFDTGFMPPDRGIGRSAWSEAIGDRAPRLWVAGNGPRTLRLTGTYADGWLPMGGISPAEYALQRQRVLDAADAAGRPAPVSAFFPLIMLGESREQVAEIFDRDPLTKMILLCAPASLWDRYGLVHPAGPDCRGYADVIPHALDPKVVREALRAVPLAMAQEFIVTGTAQDVADYLAPYVEAGLDYIVLADLTAVAQAAAATTLVGEYARLRNLLEARAGTAAN